MLFRCLSHPFGIHHSIATVFLFSITALGLAASPAKDPLVLKGKQLYRDYRCSYCHSLQGKGGTIGPALDNVGLRRTPEWMTHHFKRPMEVSPDTKMPKIHFKRSDLDALLAYLRSLGGVTYSPEAPQLFEAQCVECHNLGGGDNGLQTDLSKEGKYRDVGFIGDYIKDPSKMDSQAKMKAFKGILGPDQIKDLAAYIYLQGR